MGCWKLKKMIVYLYTTVLAFGTVALNYVLFLFLSDTFKISK